MNSAKMNEHKAKIEALEGVPPPRHGFAWEYEFPGRSSHVELMADRVKEMEKIFAKTVRQQTKGCSRGKGLCAETLMILHLSRLLLALRVQPGHAPDVPPELQGKTFSEEVRVRRERDAAHAAQLLSKATAAAATAAAGAPPFPLNELGLSQWMEKFVKLAARPRSELLSLIHI